MFFLLTVYQQKTIFSEPGVNQEPWSSAVGTTGSGVPILILAEGTAFPQHILQIAKINIFAMSNTVVKNTQSKFASDSKGTLSPRRSDVKVSRNAPDLYC